MALLSSDMTRLIRLKLGSAALIIHATWGLPGKSDQLSGGIIGRNGQCTI